ncbi:MAG TPA: OmpA family protein [Chlorobaculum parvum]|jgi:outer membrane protein OmpA-like peptidoglycan-associated protein|uniref:OmpA family protein n=1 Tax=Chlorobaculum parvum TaxID=274539 RepID=A0A7C5DBE7_9CHLB|nr:OmpA family protein [Chlorobaculum parvum]
MKTIQKFSKPATLFMLLSTATITTGCQSTTNAGRGAGYGAAAGGVIGGIIGSNNGSWAQGALIGAAIGGAAGAVIGDYMDKQAEEIRQEVGNAQVERVGEGIRVVFDTGLLFSTNSSTLNANSRYNIENLARVLNRYPDTDVVVEGHTDSTGSEATNQILSEHRAESVTSLLRAYGVSGRRLTAIGYGETRPVATNETEYGRRQNRRVEVLIYANNELKRQAETGQLRL